jgi:hypothetical protein
MSIIEILLSADFLTALFIYVLVITISLPLLEKIHASLKHPFLEWQWDHVVIPLYRAAMMILFLLLAYPVIFAVEEAPAISALLSENDLRLDYLINLLFVVSLFFPLLPVIGNWHELILPLQGILASMMIFSWLAQNLSVTDYSFWPGWEVIMACLFFGILTHWAASHIASYIGQRLDRRFNVLDSGDLLAGGLILIMQSPVILIYSVGLGSQLN